MKGAEKATDVKELEEWEDTCDTVLAAGGDAVADVPALWLDASGLEMDEPAFRETTGVVVKETIVEDRDDKSPGAFEPTTRDDGLSDVSMLVKADEILDMAIPDD